MDGPSSSADVNEEASPEGFCELEQATNATEGGSADAQELGLERTSRFSSGGTSGRPSEAATPSSPRWCGVCSPRPASPRLGSSTPSEGMEPGDGSAMSVSAVRKSISASLTGRRQRASSPPSSAEGTPRKSVQPTQMRLMRLRDQFELTQEMTNGTVLYLSPFYRQLPASGVTADSDIRNNLYNELVARFGALGVKIKSDAESAFTADQRSLMLLVLCPGFFGCPELVEETACALRNIHKERRSGRANSEDERSESALQREDSISQRRGSFSAEVSEGRFQRKPKALVALASTATSYDAYFHACPPDLKELGLFEAQFEKYPESPVLQPTAIKTLIYRLPGHHHSSRYRSGDLLHRLGGRRGKAPEARSGPTAWANVDQQRAASRDTAADQSGRRPDRGAAGRLSVRRSTAKKPTTGAASHEAPPSNEEERASTSMGPTQAGPSSAGSRPR